ncbi:MAG TPA: nuclear transport factor 2 family protein [Pyrinomonadaceae bacterium]|nr:nuclear transport factor 2 family protein [Pyrinomonadaceae bacterium]HMP65523.1 nuclear transport factor 2 family protein [Pyrinomonadaceae bacterium]
MESATAQTKDREAISRTILTYVNGGISGKSDDMRPAFHEGATIYGYIGPDLFGGPIQGLFDWNDGNGPAADLKSEIASIDIEGTIATVRLELDNWTGHRFTDMFTLLKTDGEWKIISKVFYLHPED